jgi:lysophospholipase L1-like esterase
MINLSIPKTISAYILMAALSFGAVALVVELRSQQEREAAPVEPVLVAPGKQSRLAAGRAGPIVAKAAKAPRMRPEPAAPEQPASEVPVPVADMADEAPVRNGDRIRAPVGSAISILQIGDSHTSADFFTGFLRRKLQQRYGDGGPGYVIAGRPHIGVRSDTLRVSGVEGWSYRALQKSRDRSEFVLAGFNAVAETRGRSMTFAAERPMKSDVWEVEVFRQPGGGSIDIRLDGVVERSVNLDAPKVEPVVISLEKKNAQKLTVTTTGGGPVRLSSVAAYNRSAGLTYNSVGFPGATIDIVNKFDEGIFASELRRMAPQIVVLAFGSNEGFDDNLDLQRYAKAYRLAVSKIQAALPGATIMIIGPPDGSRLGRGLGNCAWRTPAKLNGVRAIQRDLALSSGFHYWDWSSIMPAECGAQKWVANSPPLMARDHLHLSTEGYKLSAEEFSKSLIPLIDKVRAPFNVVSNY